MEYSASVAVGLFHSVILDCNGVVWTAGSNMHGELCHGDTLERQGGFKRLYGNYKGVFCGGNSTFLIEMDGLVKAAGYRIHGMGRSVCTTLEYIPNQPKIGTLMISTCVAYTLLLDNEGNVWYCNSINGIYKQIQNIPLIVKISSGDVGLLLDEMGQAWRIVDDASNGKQAILINGQSSIIDIAANSKTCLFVNDKREVLISGSHYAIPSGIPKIGIHSLSECCKLSSITQIALSESSIYLINEDGKVKVASTKLSSLERRCTEEDYQKFRNRNTYLNPENLSTFQDILNIPPIVYIDTRFQHAILIDNTGKAWGLGDNSTCQLGFVETTIDTPALIPRIPEIASQTKYNKVKSARSAK